MEDGDGGAFYRAEQRVHADPIQSLRFQISEAVTAAGLIHNILICLFVWTHGEKKQKPRSHLQVNSLRWIWFIQQVTVNGLNDNPVSVHRGHWSPRQTYAGVVWPDHADTAHSQTGCRNKHKAGEIKVNHRWGQINPCSNECRPSPGLLKLHQLELREHIGDRLFTIKLLELFNSMICK